MLLSTNRSGPNDVHDTDLVAIPGAPYEFTFFQPDVTCTLTYADIPGRPACFSMM